MASRSGAVPPVRSGLSILNALSMMESDDEDDEQQVGFEAEAALVEAADVMAEVEREMSDRSTVLGNAPTTASQLAGAFPTQQLQYTHSS